MYLSPNHQFLVCGLLFQSGSSCPVSFSPGENQDRLGAPAQTLGFSPVGRCPTSVKHHVLKLGRLADGKIPSFHRVLGENPQGRKPRKDRQSTLLISDYPFIMQCCPFTHGAPNLALEELVCLLFIHPGIPVSFSLPQMNNSPLKFKPFHPVMMLILKTQFIKIPL